MLILILQRTHEQKNPSSRFKPNLQIIKTNLKYSTKPKPTLHLLKQNRDAITPLTNIPKIHKQQ